MERALNGSGWSPDRLRSWILLGAILAGGAVAGLALGRTPWLVLGTVAGGLILLGTLSRPLVIIGVMLALGPLDLSFMTGGFKGLFESMGGLDMNGIRLIGVTAALSAVIVVDPAVARVAFGRYARWYLAFLVIAAGSVAFSISPLDGLRLLLKLAYPFLFFVTVLGVARTEKDLERLADWTLLGAAFISLVLNPVFVLQGGYLIDDAGNLRVQGVGTHQNPFSFYLLLMTLLALTRFTVRGQLRYLLLCVVFGVWIILAHTRITLAGAMVALIGLGLYSAIAGRNYRGLAAAVLVGLALAIPFTPIVMERTLGFVPSVNELLTMLRDPVALYYAMDWQGREIFWPVVGQAFLQNPLLGLGLGSSTAVILEYFPAHWGGVVHNEYLRIAADLGIAGLVLYSVAIMVWLVGVLRAGRVAHPLVREFAWPAIGGILAWAIVAITDNAFDYYSPFTQYIGFLCGGALAAAAMVRQDTAPVEEADESIGSEDRAVHGSA